MLDLVSVLQVVPDIPINRPLIPDLTGEILATGTTIVGYRLVTAWESVQKKRAREYVLEELSDEENQ